MGGYVSNLLCTVVGSAYPAYASFKALETPEQGDDTQWLTYWVVYAFFTFIENFSDVFISWFPFYYEVKLMVLLALQWPSLKLASIIYTNYIRPFLKKHEAEIDASAANAAEALKTKVSTTVSNAVKNNAQYITQYAASALAQQQQPQPGMAPGNDKKA